MLIGSYKLIKEKGRIGSWSIYVGENANGRCLLKVSPPLPIEGGYHGLRPFLDAIKDKAKQAALINVPAEIKFKECTYDPQTNRIIIVYKGDHEKITILDCLSDTKPPDMQKSLWHLGVQMAHAKGWKGLGLSDVLIDKRGCWWPDPLSLRKVFKEFEFNSGRLLIDCETDENLDIKHHEWKQFNHISDQVFKPSDGVIGETTKYKFSGDLSFIYKFYNALSKIKGYYNAEQKAYREEVSKILEERKGDFSKANEIIDLPDIKILPNKFSKERSPLMHEWFNGYFWEPVNVFASSCIIHYTPPIQKNGKAYDVQSSIDVITLTGLVLSVKGPFRNRESQNSTVFSVYNKQGEKLISGTEVILKNGLKARVITTYDDGRVSVKFDSQVVDKSEIES